MSKGVIVIILVVLYYFSCDSNNSRINERFTKSIFWTHCGPAVNLGDPCISCGLFNATDNCSHGLYCGSVCKGAEGSPNLGASCDDLGGTLVSQCTNQW
jgi:hypothetical protein